MKNLTVKIKMNSAQRILFQRGLDKNGKVQRFFTETVYKESDPYTPFRSGYLKKRANMEIGEDYIKYPGPYARYLWYGKVMVGPPPKKAIDIDLTFQGAPMRGSFWVNRMFKDKGDKIMRVTARMAEAK